MKYAMGVRNVAAANEAVRLSASDAEAHFARAVVLKTSGSVSLPEFEQAVALRPRDYYLWMELGMAREESNDPAGALTAFNEAVRLAPFYARPLWQRGNLLLRMQRPDEAFADLRKAANSDPDLIPSLIDLSWNLARFDARQAAQLGGLDTPKLHLAFAKYLARMNRPVEALEQRRMAGDMREEEKRELISQLLAVNAFSEAHDVWRNGSNMAPLGFYDGGFESSLSLDESGFGWRVSRNLKGATLSVNTGEHQSGAQSLQIEFTGDSVPEQSVVSQLLVVEPATTYRIYFSARSRDIVTGGLPLIRVSEAVGEKKLLGASRALAQGTSDWQAVEFTFTTASTTRAVTVSLQRQGCSTSPCPAFGALGLDSFSVSVAK